MFLLLSLTVTCHASPCTHPQVSAVLLCHHYTHPPSRQVSCHAPVSSDSEFDSTRIKVCTQNRLGGRLMGRVCQRKFRSKLAFLAFPLKLFPTYFGMRRIWGTSRSTRSSRKRATSAVLAIVPPYKTCCKSFSRYRDQFCCTLRCPEVK